MPNNKLLSIGTVVQYSQLQSPRFVPELLLLSVSVDVLPFVLQIFLIPSTSQKIFQFVDWLLLITSRCQ